MLGAFEHYENLLADHYTWLFGGLELNIEKNARFFQANGIEPCGNRIAVDLGCGSGFQSIPLARSGFRVIAFDQSPKLLAELTLRKDNLDITTIREDILRFAGHLDEKMELCVCMGDTLTHLESLEKIRKLFDEVAQCLEDNGKFILAFRDLFHELEELDRFITVRSEKDKIFICFLEYEPGRVKVNDLLYEYTGNKWTVYKSSYRKSRVPLEWAGEALMKAGFHISSWNLDQGVVSIVAVKRPL